MIEANDLIRNENVLVEMFNQHSISTLYNYCEKFIWKSTNCLDETTVLEKIKKYSNSSSIAKIRSSFFDIDLFEFLEARTEDIDALTKSLNRNKATGPDLISLK